MHNELGLLRGLPDLVLGHQGVHPSIIHADLLHGQLVLLVGHVLHYVVAGGRLDYVAVFVPENRSK